MKPNEINALTYSLVDVFEEDDYSEEEIFHEYTKINRETIAKISQRVNEITRDPGLVRMMSRSWKTYAGAERIKLPEPDLGDMTLQDALKNRRSVSSENSIFSGEEISLEDLSAVLHFSYGPTRMLKSKRFPGEGQMLRATTSAGGLYPLEIYPVVHNVEGLEQGIYHYRVVDHSLEVLRLGEIREEFVKTTSYHDLCGSSAVALIVSAVFRRNWTKYQHRGYRFLMNDVGALLQSLYLTGTARRLGTCALGGFYDDEVSDFIGLNKVDEGVVIGFLLGQKLKSAAGDPAANWGTQGVGPNAR